MNETDAEQQRVLAGGATLCRVAAWTSGGQSEAAALEWRLIVTGKVGGKVLLDEPWWVLRDARVVKGKLIWSDGGRIRRIAMPLSDELVSVIDERTADANAVHAAYVEALAAAVAEDVAAAEESGGTQLVGAVPFSADELRDLRNVRIDRLRNRILAGVGGVALVGLLTVAVIVLLGPKPAPTPEPPSLPCNGDAQAHDPAMDPTSANAEILRNAGYLVVPDGEDGSCVYERSP